MRSVLFALLVVALHPTASAQTPSTLDDPIAGQFRIDNPRFVHRCTIGTVVDQIARKANVPVGFENTSECWLNPRSREAAADGELLTGATAREAFDHLLELIPTYHWQEMDGVAVIRPTAAWKDSRNPLNLPTAPFSGTNAHLDNVLHLLLRGAKPSLFYPHVDVPQPARPIDRPIDVAFPGGTVLAALNAIIRARHGAEWELGYGGNHATIVVRTLEFGGGNVMAPLFLPQAR